MMSKEQLVFEVEREMKHLKKIVSKDKTLTISSRFANYLIKQAERVQNLESRLAFEQGVTSNLQSKNKRYRGAIDKAIDDLENECLWDAHVKLKALEGDEE